MRFGEAIQVVQNQGNIRKPLMTAPLAFCILHVARLKSVGQ
jgi:hypothetical protein